MFSNLPRMALWLIITIVLMLAILPLQHFAPGNLVSVTLYKAHLLALGGWGGYWLDRALFPYDRPHSYRDEALNELFDDEPRSADEPSQATAVLMSSSTFGNAMLRRAIIVAACLITVGLGA